MRQVQPDILSGPLIKAWSEVLRHLELLTTALPEKK